MQRIRKLALAALMLGVGFFAAPLFFELFPTAATWERKLDDDTLTALQVLAPDARLPADLSGETEFWKAWDRRLDAYDDAHLALLRARLELYVAFIGAEWGDVAEIYTAGTDPGRTSEAARAVRDRIRAEIPGLAEKLLADAHQVREQAYAASPAHSGLDPDLPDYGREAAVIADWLPAARARAVELTTRAAER